MPNKSKVFSIPFYALITALLASPAFATIIRVPQDQPTIQAGIDSASRHDTVLVGPGIYNENLNFNGKSIVLKSVSGPDSTTIHNVSDTLLLPIIQVMGVQDILTSIEGFRLYGGRGRAGGGIRFDSSKGSIIGNVFEADTTAGGGGAIGCFNLSDVKIRSNIFQNNIGQTGTVWAQNSTVEISRNLIIDNPGFAAVLPIDTAIATIVNNTFVNNGSAISCQEWAIVDIRNNIFVNNVAYGVHVNNATVTIDYNDFVNSPLIEQATLGVGNISIDPFFVGGSPFNYHLQLGSPCIDTGDPTTPVPYGGGARVDMGAFEYPQFPQFELLSPAENATIPSRRPLFVWKSLRDTIQSIEANYSVFLSTKSSFMPTDTFPISRDTFWQVSFPLDFHQTYFWRVMAVTDSADTFFSLESRNFKIIDAPPGSFSLTAPLNNIKIVTKTPVLQWANANDPDPVDTVMYTAIISSDSGFLFAYSQPNLASNSFMVPPGVLNRGLRYFWKVKASDTQDSTTFSNDIFRFRLLYLGDVNGDGILSPSDIVLLINHVFLAVSVDPPEVADINCDGNSTPADVVLGLNAVFLGQPPPCDP